MRWLLHRSNDALSRLVAYIQESDSGIICAYRKNSPEGVAYTHREHQLRSRSLLAKLLMHGYSVTSLEGGCTETETTEKEEYLFFVRDDLSKHQKLEARLRQYGEEFHQDFVLFIPKSGTNALVISTNPSTARFGLGEKFPILGKEAEVLRRVDGRPFCIGDKILGEHYCGSLMGRWAASVDAGKPWNEIMGPGTPEPGL